MENADEHDPSNADSGPSIRASNASERSVSELSAALKRILEENFSFVRVRGEVSRVSRPGSGHVYFDLKDAGAAIAAVIWKGVAGKLKVKPEQGLEVIVTGRVTTFPGQSKYQIVVESMEPAGVGALMALLEERKKKLAAEGLFAAGIKKKLPFLPKVVGVVTSPTGAVIRDILHRLSDRFPIHVIVWPVRVQGESCALEVATAIRGFNALPVAGRIPRPDVLIVARGGGSIEDLWGFNEEVVARATFESQIPIVSAVGHETDTTLIDYVADLRAPTPTAAAEFVVPVRLDLLSRVNDRSLRLESMVHRLSERRRRDFSQIVRAMPDVEDLVGRRRQQLDLSSARLSSAARNTLDRRALLLAKLGRRLGAQTPEARLIRFRERLQMLGPRLGHAGAARLMRRRDQLTALARQLKSLSYHSILDRGFAVVRARGGPLLRAADVPADAALTLEFADGRIAAKALGAPEKPAPRRAAPRSGTKQPGLFDES